MLVGYQPSEAEERREPEYFGVVAAKVGLTGDVRGFWRDAGSCGGSVGSTDERFVPAPEAGSRGIPITLVSRLNVREM